MRRRGILSKTSRPLAARTLTTWRRPITGPSLASTSSYCRPLSSSHSEHGCEDARHDCYRSSSLWLSSSRRRSSWLRWGCAATRGTPSTSLTLRSSPFPPRSFCSICSSSPARPCVQPVCAVNGVSSYSTLCVGVAPRSPIPPGFSALRALRILRLCLLFPGTRRTLLAFLRSFGAVRYLLLLLLLAMVPTPSSHEEGGGHCQRRDVFPVGHLLPLGDGVLCGLLPQAVVQPILDVGKLPLRFCRRGARRI